MTRRSSAGAANRFGEREAIRLLARTFAAGRSKSSSIALGIGDDAAIMRAPRGGGLVWTSDACVEGIHFERTWMTWEDVGWRSFNAAVSDIAAMGGEPLAALSNLILPAEFSEKALAELARGQAKAARLLRCPVVGGNLSRGRELSVTTTVLGECEAPLLRSTARVGDELWLVGDVGLSRSGYELLRRQLPLRSRAAKRALEAFRRPEAQVTRGKALASRASAALDVSDGLNADAPRLAEASGVRVCIEERALEYALTDDLSALAATLGTSAVALALAGGEDYALLAAGPAERRPRWARRIGRIERGRGAWFQTERGQRQRLEDGFDHLAPAAVARRR